MVLRFIDNGDVLLFKYNPHHAKDGKFTSKPGGSLTAPIRPDKEYKERSEWTDDDILWHELGLGKPLSNEYSQYLKDWDNYNRQITSRAEAQKETVKREWENRGGDNMRPPQKAQQTEYEGFSTDTTGVSHYDDFLTPDGLKHHQSKGKTGYIAEMSPQEYIERCAKQIFHSTVENQSNIKQIDNGEGKIMDFASKMQNGIEFDMPYLDYTDGRT